MVNRFNLKNDFLVLEEPDMQSFPINYIPSLDNTARSLRHQSYVVASLETNKEPLFPSIQQAVMLADSYKPNNPFLILERTEPDKMFSGWFISNHLKDKNSEDFSPVSVYQFCLDHPDLFKFLALPVGFQVLTVEKLQSCIYSRIYRDGIPVNLKPKSFLFSCEEKTKQDITYEG